MYDPRFRVLTPATAVLARAGKYVDVNIAENEYHAI